MSIAPAPADAFFADSDSGAACPESCFAFSTWSSTPLPNPFALFALNIPSFTSAFSASRKPAVTAPDPMVSIRAATELAWHSRVQWSTLLVPNPVRTSFCTR